MTSYMPILVLGTLFSCMIIVFAIIMISDNRNFTRERDKFYMEKLVDLKNEVTELRSLITTEVKDVFDNIKKILK